MPKKKFIKPLHLFFGAVYYHLVLTGKVKRNLQPVKGGKTPLLIPGVVKTGLANIL